jgi:hypothetical protein
MPPTGIISKRRLSRSRAFSIVTLVYETNRHMIEIICHYKFRKQGINDTSGTGRSRPPEQLAGVSHVPRNETDIDFLLVN